MNEAKQYREFAEAFRSAANEAEKVADLIEKNGTPEEMDEAMKNFIWKLMKAQAAAES